MQIFETSQKSMHPKISQRSGRGNLPESRMRRRRAAGDSLVRPDETQKSSSTAEPMHSRAESGPPAPAGIKNPPPPSDESGDESERLPSDGRFICRLCGYEHQPVRLARGERAVCARCGATLAKGVRDGADVPLAFAITGLIFALPAAVLPVLTASKFGNEHSALILSGVAALSHGGLQPIAMLVLICGILGPVVLLAILIALLLTTRLGAAPPPAALFLFAQQLSRWAMPEVHVLAVLVAFAKLGDLVTISIGPGLWFYGGMVLSIVIAWRSFDLEIPAPVSRHGEVIS
jgi:paraquat-inducible protein A